jgi:hypothetical protein
MTSRGARTCCARSATSSDGYRPHAVQAVKMSERLVLAPGSIEPDTVPCVQLYRPVSTRNTTGIRRPEFGF